MSESRVVAVDHVELQAQPGCEAELTWFYSEFLGFAAVEELPRNPPRLRFRSADLEIRYSFTPQPVIEATDHRVTLLVPFLREARKTLDKARISYEAIRGTAFTDRYLSLLDAGGNRVALRQMWRVVT